MNAKRIIISISRRALLARIGRALKARGQQLAVDRRGGAISHLIIEGKTIIKRDVDVHQLARKLQLLKPWERIA